jgi:hypothetical protein
LPMATSEAGGIVPQELRELLALELMRCAVTGPVNYGMDECREDADAILAEIKSAGYVAVETGRLKDVVFNYEVAVTCAQIDGVQRAWERDERVLMAWLGE